MSNKNIEFQDSQIHWIGQIPKHWEIKKVKDGFYLKKDKALIENPVVLTLARSGIKVRDLENNEGQFAKSYLEYNLVEIDDLLLNTMDLQSGDNCNISRIQGVISPAYANLRYKNGFSPNFYNYYFKIQYWTFAFFTHGKGVSYENRWTLNNQTLMRFPLLVPPLNEQKEIAEFLDKKCEIIDKRLNNLERKIKSLKEYKKSLISECVTKGLNSKILEFKDSGIPWIGQIPKHWEIIRLGYICNKLNRKIDENDEPLICSNKGQVAFRDKNACGKMLSENHTMQGIQVGDIAIHGMDTWHGAIAYSNLKGKITGVVHVCDSKENNKFIVYFLQYLAIQGVYKLISNGVRGNTSDFRSWNSVKNIYIIVPPLNEQKEIAEILDKKCEKIDNLSANYKEQIKTLKEYKQALIYECVTGKKQI